MGKITATAVATAVREVLLEIQAMGPHPACKITPGLCPIGGIPGFDSLLGVEAMAMLEQRLAVKLPNECLFVGQGRPATVREVVERVAAVCRSA